MVAIKGVCLRADSKQTMFGDGVEVVYLMEADDKKYKVVKEFDNNEKAQEWLNTIGEFVLSLKEVS